MSEVASPAMYFSGLVLVPRKRRFRAKTPLLKIDWSPGRIVLLSDCCRNGFCGISPRDSSAS